MYYTAASLVRHGQASQLYTGADTGTDPQKVIASPDTPIYQAARSEGLFFVGLYVYPPVLADLLLPLTLVPLPLATTIWFAVNSVFLVLTAFCVIQLLRLPLRSWRGALILLSLFCFTPVLQCFVDGQITILLLLLWAAGMLFYDRDRPYASAAVFGLATAIKLTPAIVLLPFLLWRKWRFVGAFLGTLLCLVALCFWIDTPDALLTYGRRVLPAMSGSIPFFTNYSLAAATQRLVTLLRTGSVAPFPEALAPSTVLIGRIASTGTLVVLLAVIARMAPKTGKKGQVLVLGLLGLMAPILSPVSWFHAYATAFLAFALLWGNALRRPPGWGYLVTLTLVTLLLGSPVSENLISTLMLSQRTVPIACYLEFGQLLIATALVLYEIWTLHSAPDAFAPGSVAA